MVTPTDLTTAKERLLVYRRDNDMGPHRAAILASVIWPDGKWLSAQGAGAAATRVLKKLGCHWTRTKNNWGWILTFPNDGSEPRRTGLPHSP